MNARLMVCGVGWALLLLAASSPAAQPATAPLPGRGQRSELLLQRFHSAIADLKLTDDQKNKIEDVLASTRRDLQQMASEFQQLSPPERADRIRQLMTDVRQKISENLDESQRTLLEQKIRELRADARGPATQPAGEARPMVLIQRFMEAVQKLDLSPDQKEKIKSVAGSVRSRLTELRERAAGDALQLRDGARQIFSDARGQLADILTAEQQQQLRQLMEGNPSDAPRALPPGEKRAPAAPTIPPKMESDKPQMNPDDNGNSADRPTAGKAAAAPEAPIAIAAGPAVGDAAPAFSLQKLDGRPVQLSSFKGKILVIVFGSYSSPSFRQRALAIQDLAREAGAHASFLLIYTREAHPKDGWQVERNRDDEIELPAPHDQAGRIAMAKKARDALKLTLPIAVDDFQNTVASAYGAGENSAYVIGRDGIVLARQKWADPFAIRREIDQSSTRPATADAVN
jgi:peroxiredoxin